MSRLYDALKQASRSRGSTDGISAEEECEVFGINGVHSSPAASRRDANEADVGAPLATRMPDTDADPWVISPERGPHRRASNHGNGSFVTRAKVALDHTARVIPNAADPALVEHYRRLRTKIMQQYATRAFRSLLVTSANPQEGKTVTAFNLALSFAMLPSFKVLLVDGDLRRAGLGRLLGVNDRPGLSNLIDGSAGLEDVVVKCDEIPIHFIPSGTSKMPSAELLHSSQLSGHFRKMTEQFDLVLADSPPVNVTTDAQLLAANCDALLLVARAFVTTRKTFDKAVQDLAPFRVIGTVLNGSTGAHLYQRYKGHYH